MKKISLGILILAILAFAGLASAEFLGYQNNQLVSLFPTAAVTTDNTAGSGADLLPLTGTVAIILDSAAGTGTTPSMTFKIQHSSTDNTSLYTDVSGAAFSAVDNTAGGGRQVIFLNKDVLKRYVRAVARVSGNTPSFTCSVHLLGRKQY
jgi:hypothetical protein